MKKWYGGTLVAALALVLLLGHTLNSTHPSTAHQAGATFNLRDSVASTYPSWTKKTHLLSNLQGLPDLYFLANTSEMSRVTLAWAHMLPLLSRSDALPDTAKGVREAASAWRHLLATVATVEDHPDNDNVEEKVRCPWCVKGASAHGKGNSTMELPCGLVQDSAVTLVGVSGSGGFAIELVRVEAREAAAKSVVLQYRVRFGEEEEKRGDVISQNTWTADKGWGEEESCPADGKRSKLAGNVRMALEAVVHRVPVDGLVLCDEQMGRSIANESMASSQGNNGKSQNISTGSKHASSSFPFVKGQIFTATLWTGLEGFHMTVNGRHETSFAYREALEPWLVNRVTVAGDVELLSIITNGLPVAEDIDMIANIQSLKAPPLPENRTFLFIGVFSAANNFQRRMALRRTWMQYEAVRAGNVVVRFFTGLHKSNEANLELWEEAHTYDDIQLMPFVDYYSLISLKTIAISIFGRLAKIDHLSFERTKNAKEERFVGTRHKSDNITSFATRALVKTLSYVKYMTKILPAKYIMKTDDDAFVRIDEVLSILKQSDSSGLLYGLITFQSAPHRDMESKWYISGEEWPQESYPPWAHGPGYIISEDIAKFIVQGHQKRTLQLFKLEDVAVGIWINEFKKTGREVHYANDERFHSSNCEDGYVLAHYQGPRLILCLWEKLQKEHEPVCCD